ncbi:MAG: TIGR03987 family protein [Eubacteriales bacterium]
MTQNLPLLIAAIVTITLALVFYTTGVWSEKMQGQLKKWHLLLFWTGIIFDTTGTTLMGTAVLVRNRESERKSFHKLSLFVRIIWLIPYLSGMIFGMIG